MCIATMKSLTLAMKAKGMLEARGIRTEIVNLDPSLTKRGCSFGISFPRDSTEEVRRTLDSKKIMYGEIIGENRGSELVRQ